MPHLCYQLKIEPANDNQVYRVIKIDGSRTFADLSNAILDAFEFDHSHLYMFSRSRKPYDPNGIYHPKADGDISADEVCLQDVKLAARNKFLYLYDFGDDWMFYITVMGIKETDQETSVMTIQSKGNLCQYPDWEDDECFDDECFDDEDELSGDEDDYGDSDDLVIVVVDEADEVVAERLLAIPFLLRQMWIRLVEKDLYPAGYEEINLLCRLEAAGLVDVYETEKHLYLKVRCGKKNWKEYGIAADHQKWCAFERTLLSLVGIYGVIERDLFYGLLCDDARMPSCSEREFDEVVERLGRWDFWTIMKLGDGKTYITSFCSTIAEEILHTRKKYPVKWYCTVEDSLWDDLASGEWKSAFPVYGKVFRHLFFECRWEPENVSGFLEQLLKCIALGMTEQEYFDWISDSFQENGIQLTKRMKKLFRGLRDDFPSAALKGYTWGEYEKHRKDGYHQLTLFEEELPFQ